MKLKYTPLTALTCAAFLGSAAMSQAAVTIGDIISVNLRSDNTSSTPTGAAVIGVIGDTWTQITGTGWESAINGTYALNKTTGASSGVSMTFSGQANAHGNANASNLDVFESGFFLGEGETTATITFSGFTAGTIIDLYLYAGGWTTGEGATFNFGSAQTATNTVDIETTYNLGNNYVKFSGLVANGSGNITGTWTNPNTYSVFNGAQIEVTAIPEPSAALLGGLGLLALLRRRR
jgi:hypothetical protein